MRKIIGDGRMIPSNEDAEKDQADQRKRFGGCKNILNPFAEPYTERVQERDQYNHQNADKLLDAQTDCVFRPEINWMNDPGLRGNRGKQNAEVARKTNRDGRDSSRLNDQEERPAIQKAPERRIGFAQVNILPAGAREKRRKFAERQCSGNCQKTSD